MKRVLSLLIALVLCALPALSEAPDEMELLRRENEMLKNRLEAYEDAGIIAVFDVGQVTFDEVYAAYSELIDYYRSVYEAFGMEYRPDAAEEMSLQTELARSIADEKLLAYYLADRGIQLLSPEDLERVREDARTDYALICEENRLYYLEEGYGEEEAKLLAEQYMQENGLSEDDLYEAYLNAEKQEALVHFLAGEIVLSDEEINAVYEAHVEADREYYTEYPDEFAFDALYSDNPVTYVPEGYTRMQLLLLGFDEETQERYDELYNDGLGYSEEAEQMFSLLRPEADQVYSRLLGGEDFALLMKQYSAVPYLGEMGQEEGFYVNAQFDQLDDEALNAMLELKVPGEFTKPVRTPWGWAIIRCLEEVPSGAVPLANVYDELYLIAYEDKLNASYEAAMEDLRQELRLTFFFDRLG